jgi:hypothetical protein
MGTRTAAAVLSAFCLATLPWMTRRPAEGSCDGSVSSRCTVFTVSKGNRVFFGGNDDYVNPDSYYWVDPGGAQRYGAIWVGEPDNVQQGVNEKGLAYDANGLPRVDVNPHGERIPVTGGYASYPIHILRECATVEEVIAWVKTHQWHSYMHDQMHFADATGDAVVISAGADGEVALTRKPRGDGYLVSTNFNVANPGNGFQYPCPRYQTAQDLLGKLVRREGELTARDAADVLDAVHMEGATSWTIVSLVADLPNGTVHAHYFHQFDKPVVLNVAEEIARARAAGPLSRLFPEDVRQEAARRYQRYQARKSRCEVAGKAWLGLVLGALATLLTFSLKRRQGWLLWLPVVVVLGPLGLLAWAAAGRERKPGPWRAALVEAVGDVVPTAVAFVTMLVAFVLGLAALGWRAQVLVLLSVPLLVGWLLFQGPLLALGAKRSLPRILCQRLPQVWVAANLGMAGISAVAAPLATTCPLVPLSSWTVVTWWATAALSAPAGALLLFAYELWAVRRGFRAWSILASGEGDVVTPAWRRLWWWLPLSYVVLIAGVVASVLIQRLLSA